MLDCYHDDDLDNSELVENIDIGKNNKINNVHEEHLNINYSMLKK